MSQFRQLTINFIALLAALVSMLTILTVPSVSLAAPPASDISSDLLEQQEGKYIFKGSVRIKQDGYTLWADRAVYTEADGSLVAEGSVVINSVDFSARGQSAVMDMEKGTGVLKEARVLYYNGGYHVDAEELTIAGDGHFLLKQADITTCEDLPADWCFSGSKVDILVGERITATNARLKVRGIPILYTPYLWAPIVEDRRTGFLPPSIGYRNSTGMHVSLPFFWAISENRDATITLDYHSREAFGQEVQYRYIEAPHISGDFNIMHLRDTDRDLDYVETRMRHRHDGTTEAGFINLHIINHEDYYRLYEDYLMDSSRRYLESTMEVYHSFPPEKLFGNSRLYISARHYQDLKEDANQDTVLQRRPEAGLAIAPFGPGSLDVFGRVRSVSFERDEGIEGTRADFEGSASITFGSAFVLRQEAGAIRHTYELQDDGKTIDLDQSELTIYKYRADMGFTASRSYGSVIHEIEPALIFNRTVLEGEAPTVFDQAEAAKEESMASLQALNYLTGKKGRFLTLNITQPYDFLSQEEPYAPFEAQLSANPSSGPLFASVSTTYDHYDKQVSSIDSRLGIIFSRASLAVGHQYNRLASIETYSLNAIYKANDALGFFAGLRYDEAEEKGLEELSGGFKYKSQCWGAKLSYVQKPDEDYSVSLEFSLLGGSRTPL